MNDQKIIVREATLDDRNVLWEWYNEPLRQIAFSKNQHISYDRHRAWFENSMADEKWILCVCVEDTLRIGGVRYDQITDMEYEIHFYLKPAYCGKGYGVRILKVAVDYLRRSRGFKKLFAVVKKQGPASQDIFKKAGFNLVNESDSIMHWELNG